MSAATEKTAAHILASAAEVFLEKGYTATTMRAIQDASRRSRYTLYECFESKEEIFREILATIAPQLTAELGARPIETLAAIFDAALVVRQDPELGLLISRLAHAIRAHERYAASRWQPMRA